MKTTPKKPQTSPNSPAELNQAVEPPSQPLKTKDRPKISAIFTIPLWPVPLVLIAGAIGWISWQSGRTAVSELTGQLQTKTTQQVRAELDNYLNTPHRLNQINVQAIASGVINPDDYEGISRLFWEQMQVFNIGYISYGTNEGRFIGVGKKPNGEFSIDSLPTPAEGNVYFYNVSEQGDRNNQSRRIKEGYQPREDAWYADAAQSRTPVWSQIYRWQPWYEIAPDQIFDVVSISASSPILDNKGQLIGVIGTELPLNYMSDFLRDLEVDQVGEVFIMERDGRLVASSSDRSILNADGERLLASEIQEPLIQATANYLNRQEVEDLSAMNETQMLSFDLNGARQLVEVIPWRDQYGLDWLIVTTIPESAFMGDINAGRNQTLALIIFAVAIAGGLGVLAARWVAKPIRELNQVAEAVGNGNLQARAVPTGSKETQILAHSFNRLVEQVKELIQEQAASMEQQQKQQQDIEAEIFRLINDIEDAAEGDLTVRAQLMAGDIGIIADLFNAVIENLQETAQQVKDAASRVSASLEENETEIREMTQSAIAEATEIQTTLQSVGMMNQSIQAVAQNAQKAAAIADSALNTAQEGNLVMEQTVQTIQGLQSTVTETAKKMQQMGKSAQKISQVVSLIDQISLKTTLLAMNASVEANRAGEMGQGFTAVAEQVEALAEQSASAAKDIAQIVASIQHETQEAIETIEQESSEVVASTRSVEQAKARLSEVVQRSEEINRLMQSISEATVPQAETSAKVSQLMEQVARSSQDRSQTSKTLAQAIQETAQVAQNLKADVDKFKVTKDS